MQLASSGRSVCSRYEFGLFRIAFNHDFEDVAAPFLSTSAAAAEERTRDPTALHSGCCYAVAKGLKVPFATAKGTLQSPNLAKVLVCLV